MYEKATSSLDSAKILKENGEQCYCMSAQCAYYSGLQMAMWFLMLRHNFSAEELFNWFQDEKNKSPSGRGNSHSFYLNKFRGILKSITNRRIAEKLNTSLLDLKILRETAAYGSARISLKELENAIENANMLNKDISVYIKMEQERPKI